MENLVHTVKEGKLGMEIYVEDPKEGGYTAFFKDFPKLVTQGETIEDAQNRLWIATYDILKNFFNK
jgi:hypothetical protein